MSHPNDDPQTWTNAHVNPAGVTDASVDVHGESPVQSLQSAPVDEVEELVEETEELLNDDETDDETDDSDDNDEE